MSSQLTEGQRKAGQAGAVAARRRRAEIKEMLATGELSGDKLIALSSTEDAVGRLTISDTLRALRSVGPTKAKRWCAEHGIDEGKRLRALGVHQQETLIAMIEKTRNRLWQKDV